MENTVLASSSVATRTPLILHSFPQKKLMHMFTKLSVFGVEMPYLLHFLVEIWMLRFFCGSRTRLSGYRDDALFSEWQRNLVLSLV